MRRTTVPPTNMIQPGNNPDIQRHSWWRQSLDCCLSLFALLLLLPLLLAIAASIFFETGLPIMFSQGRVGRDGKLFRLLKFRSMRRGARGRSITVGGDQRITRVGRYLRKFKLDELPQLWNVARGEMSLVGPRPEVPEFVNLRNPMWRSVLRVRPGITDPASIAFNQEEKLLATSADPDRYYREILLPAKLAMNISYLRNRNVWRDFQVILQTIFCAVFPGKLAIDQTVFISQDPK